MGAKAYVALGSNLGDRDAHLAFAIQSLDEVPGVDLLECSGVYETAAVGPGDQGPYLNAVVCLHTTLEPEALLDEMLAIEEKAGRLRDGERDGRDGTRWLPRSLDLDLLFFGDRRIDQPGLTVPHPRIAERSFVLVPLSDLAPELVHPGLSESMASLLAKLPGSPPDGSLPAGIRPWERCLRIGR